MCTVHLTNVHSTFAEPPRDVILYRLKYLNIKTLSNINLLLPSLNTLDPFLLFGVSGFQFPHHIHFSLNSWTHRYSVKPICFRSHQHGLMHYFQALVPVILGKLLDFSNIQFSLL